MSLKAIIRVVVFIQILKAMITSLNVEQILTPWEQMKLAEYNYFFSLFCCPTSVII